MTSRQNAIYNKTVLNNGLRIVTEKIPSVRSVAIGIWIDVGSRDETERENGLSHFIEHMLFKGTRCRSAQKIAFSLESLGGSLNAFTSREQTCYHALVLDRHIEQAVDVLSDILMNSTLSPIYIEREKSVIIEEIREVDETPSDHIHELFSSSLWRGQSLGRPIMGTEKNVRSFKRRDVNNYMKMHYRAGRVIVAAAGNVSHRKLTGLIRDKLAFQEGSEGRGPAMEIPTGFSAKSYRNGSNQIHVCLGFPGISYADPEKFALLALHNYLGAGMSSVLFQKIREDRGMAYTVYTFPDFYRDCGVFGAYMATDIRHLHEAIETILKEFKKLKKTGLSQAKLDKIKDQLKGSLLLGMESTSGRMNRLARQEIYFNDYFYVKDTMKSISRITPRDMLEIAQKIFNSGNLTITILGSADNNCLNKANWALL